MKNSLFVLLILFSLCQSKAQKINHTSALKDFDCDRYFRFSYDNDYFSSSDENYTQGYNIEFVAPVFAKNPINYLLFKNQNWDKKYGLSIEHIGYTPNKIGRSEIQYDDRPFASAIMLKSFIISTDTCSKSRISTSLSLGAIGPLAFGKEMQTAIHRAIDGTIPQGWKHQISNDIVINYQLSHEKQMLMIDNLFELQTYASANLGTLFTSASVGITTLLGQFNSILNGNGRSKKFDFYIYSQPVINFIGYDATLQGGLFNDSPYTIKGDTIKRITFQYNFGLVIKSKKLYLEYSRTYITPEFNNGPTAGWGGLRVGAKF
uniref:lipid A deacylase LpxR family protein n=1 Tax=Fulvivirga sp. TaxID=1931237 RepID=UPI00404B9BC1